MSVAVGIVEIRVLQSPLIVGKFVIVGTGASESPTTTFKVIVSSQPPVPEIAQEYCPLCVAFAFGIMFYWCKTVGSGPRIVGSSRGSKF